MDPAGKIFAIIGIIVCVVLLPFAGLMALMSPMSFDAPGSAKSPIAWFFFLFFILAPVFLIVVIILLALALSKRKESFEKKS
ncbi:MAG: hypothetical protein A2351_02910 [Omnitrophica bacterium RIFOXYB12_FULL_50_7]|nr:MAG: hypothetical protein A2351_02910 [Omnitrophica bacterium RIFOXYB12_FULL_50_7]